MSASPPGLGPFGLRATSAGLEGDDLLSCFFAPPSFAAAFGFDALFGDVTSASERFSDGVRTLACVVRIMLGLRGGEKASSTAGTVYCLLSCGRRGEIRHVSEPLQTIGLLQSQMSSVASSEAIDYVKKPAEEVSQHGRRAHATSSAGLLLSAEL